MLRTTIFLAVLGLFAQGSSGHLLGEEVRLDAQATVQSLGSLMDDARQLILLVETATNLHQELQLQAVPAHKRAGMNIDACMNMTTSLLAAQKLATNLVQEGYGAVSSIAVALNNILDCPSLNPIKAVTCMIDDIKVVKQNVEALKPMIAKAKVDIRNMYVEIHAELLECVGIEHIFN